MGDNRFWRLLRHAHFREAARRLRHHAGAVRKGRSITRAVRDLARLTANEGVGGVLYRVSHELTQAFAPPPGPPEPVAPERLTTTYPFSVALSWFYDPDEEVLRANRAITERFAERPSEVKSATWFLCAFNHALFGGVYTILRLMDWMKQHHGVEHRLVIYDHPTITDIEIRSAIADAFPSLQDIDIVLPIEGRVPFDAFDELPPTDITVATIWLSAFALARFNATAAKFYMVQDYEPAFYAAGTLGALAESTYHMGYAGLVNTPGLGEIYNTYGNPSIAFTPAVDRQAADMPKPSTRPGMPVQIVIYGRPNTERNAFELIAAACRHLKQRYGDRVRIVSAGGEWDPVVYDLDGIVENVGLLRSLDEVHDLYLESDIGVCFMLSKHPSYQPFEYFSARTAVVANVNHATEWLLRHEENCLISEPFPNAIANAMGRLVDDPELRAKLANAGYEVVSTVSWDAEFEKVWGFITGAERGT